MERDDRRDQKQPGAKPPAATLPENIRRPTCRSECVQGPRPCPWVSCRYHLFLDVTEHGSLRMPHGKTADDLLAMQQTCSLDVADDGGLPVREISDLFKLSDFGARLILNKALGTLSRRRKLADLAPHGQQVVWHQGRTAAHTWRRTPRQRPDLSAFVRSVERKDHL